MDFYAEFKKLVFAKPRNCVNSRAIENSAFGDYLYRCKNVYLGFFLTDAVDSYYATHLNKATDCVDSDFLSACELCYECLDCTNLYNCSYLQDCHNCSDLDFCYDCLNCKNCFGSFGLRQQQFCVFNKQYPEKIYHKKIAGLKKTPAKKILEVLQPEFAKHPRLFCRLIKGGEDSFGDYLYFTKNCYSCFNLRNAENCMYVTNVMSPEFSSSSCADSDFATQIENCYECESLNICTNCDFAADSVNCSDCQYIINCYNCMDCLGCVYLENKQYCILNRQFTREEYKVAAAKIKKDLKEARIYGKPLAEILS